MTRLRYPEKKYLSRYDLSQEFFENLNIKVLDVIPLRKVFILKTEAGKKILKRLDCDKERADFINICVKSLKDNFNYMVDFNTFEEDKVYKVWKGQYYMLMDLISGREVTFTNPIEFNLSGELLAKYHKASKEALKSAITLDIDKSMVKKYEEAIMDIKEIKRLVSSYRFKDEFDKMFLASVDEHIMEMKKALELISFSSYSSYRKDINNCVICHNDLAEHNFLISNQGMYLLDFDYCSIDLKVIDLADLILKGIKNVAFNFEKAIEMIKSYNSVENLNDEDFKLLYILILFPRDFYTMVSDYYHKNKDWDKEVFINRFQNKLENEEFRKEFLRNYKREFKEKFY